MPESKPPPGPWRPYADDKPQAPGFYEWRLESRACPGLTLGVFAKFRERGAGYDTVLSPEFDHWNGYRVHVPNCEWREAPSGLTERDRLKVSFVEGIALEPCPFCKAVPSWEATECSSSGGVVICPRPGDLNSWRVRCCRWAASPWFNDPRKLAEARAQAVGLYSAAPDLLEALREAERVFRSYAALHAGKGTAEGLIKSNTNLEHANACQRAIAKAEGRHA